MIARSVQKPTARHSESNESENPTWIVGPQSRGIRCRARGTLESTSQSMAGEMLLKLHVRNPWPVSDAVQVGSLSVQPFVEFTNHWKHIALRFGAYMVSLIDS